MQYLYCAYVYSARVKCMAYLRDCFCACDMNITSVRYLRRQGTCLLAYILKFKSIESVVDSIVFGTLLC